MQSLLYKTKYNLKVVYEKKKRGRGKRKDRNTESEKEGR
jgi:hypothetical protein